MVMQDVLTTAAREGAVAEDAVSTAVGQASAGQRTVARVWAESPVAAPCSVVNAASSLTEPTSRSAAPASAAREGQVADPADWLDAQLTEFAQGAVINPYAELLLRAAGFGPGQR